MRGHYQLILSDGKEVPMRFCTWSLKRFCQLQGIGPAEIEETLSGKQTLDAIVNLFKAAAEYHYIAQGLSHNITEFMVCEWIDDFGGLSSPKFTEIMNVLAESLNSGVERQNNSNDSDEVKKN
jgi:hypothetical protein